MSTRHETRAPLGRRSGVGAGEVRETLLDAGRKLLNESGLHPVSLHDVAARAGANPAMVRYYFGSKQGFLQALLDEGFEELVEAIAGQRTLRGVVHRAIAKLNTMPWLPVLLTQSVYLSDELREHFIASHAPRLVGALTAVAGQRKGVQNAHAALVILSALIFPQLARPVVSRVFGIRFDERFAATFAAELARIFGDPGAAGGDGA